MAFYKVYGKWYHLEYSDYFEEIVQATSPRKALLKVARCLSDVDRDADISWDSQPPKVIYPGQLALEPTFWVGDDQVFKVRSITEVERQEIECPTCKGTGKALGYVEVELTKA